MVDKPICRICGTALNDENWYPSRKKGSYYICKKCECEQKRQWRKANLNKAKAALTRQRRKQGALPMSKNKECPAYLGVHIAEQVLYQAFKNVKRMPYGNPGYDIICNHNKLIDVKSSCKTKNQNGWAFHIKHNTTADYFLCLAFDSRKNLNPLYAWLLPGSKFNHLMTTPISPRTIHRWDKYHLDTTKVSQCCDMMRGIR